MGLTFVQAHGAHVLFARRLRLPVANRSAFALDVCRRPGLFSDRIVIGAVSYLRQLGMEPKLGMTRRATAVALRGAPCAAVAS